MTVAAAGAHNNGNTAETLVRYPDRLVMFSDLPAGLALRDIISDKPCVDSGLPDESFEHAVQHESAGDVALGIDARWLRAKRPRYVDGCDGAVRRANEAVPAGILVLVISGDSAGGAQRFFNVQRWTQMPTGGHSAAFEGPALLAEDIRPLFRPLRE